MATLYVKNIKEVLLQNELADNDIEFGMMSNHVELVDERALDCGGIMRTFVVDNVNYTEEREKRELKQRARWLKEQMDSVGMAFFAASVLYIVARIVMM